MSVIKSGISVGIGTLLSRFFGLFRELLIAGSFGTSIYGDAINTAFKLPNLFRRILGEGALSIVFIPIFSTILDKDKKAASKFSGEVFTMLLIVSIFIVILFEIFMPQLMYIFAPGFAQNKEKFIITVFLCRITMPYLIFIVLTALLGAMLNSIRRFAAFAFAPIIVNLAMIIGCLLYSDKAFSASIVSISLLFGGVFQILFLFIMAKKSGIRFKLENVRNLSKNSWNFLKSMPQAASTHGVAQLNIFISQSIASFSHGAVSILSYADRIYQLPLSMIGICFSTILLPELSKLYDKNKNSEAITLQTNAIKLGLLISLPAAFGIIALSHPITHILYERGAFSSDDTFQTALTIIAFTIGLPAYILSKILSPIFYSNMDVNTPFKITLYSIFVNIILNVILMIWFKHVGIALGTSISAWFNIYLLIYFAKKKLITILNEKISIFALKILLQNIIMAVFVYYLSIYFSYYLYEANILVKILALSMIIISGILIYGLSLIITSTVKISIKDKKIFW